MIILLAIIHIFSKLNYMVVIYIEPRSNIYLKALRYTLRIYFTVNSRNILWILIEYSVIANAYLKVVEVKMVSRI